MISLVTKKVRNYVLIVEYWVKTIGKILNCLEFNYRQVIKMTEIRFPLCPVCNQETMLPFSSDHVSAGGKTFSCWFCPNCGFYLTTVNRGDVNPEKDIKAGINLELKKKIHAMKEYYQKTKE